MAGQLEAADPLADRPGEGAALVAEELAFEQPGGNRGTVQLDEGLVAPGAEGVDGAGHQLLARMPVSPRMSTVESVGATVSISASTRRSASLWPTMSSNSCSERISSCR